jgi:uncharacterized protein HemX
LNDSRAKLQEIESVVVKNVSQANRTVEQELGRFEKIIAALEKYIEQQVSEVKQQMGTSLDEWRTSKGDSMAEISRRQEQLQTNIGIINANVTKIEEDGRDRTGNIKDEVRNIEAQHS